MRNKSYRKGNKSNRMRINLIKKEINPMEGGLTHGKGYNCKREGSWS